MRDDRFGVPEDYEDIYSGDERRDEINAARAKRGYTGEEYRSFENRGNRGQSAGRRERYDYEDEISDTYLEELAGYRPPKNSAHRGGENRPVKYKDVYSDSRGRGKPKKKNKKKRSALKSFIAIVLVLALGIVCAGGYYAYSLIDSVNYVKAQRTNVYLDSAELVSDKKVVNILLLGIDTDENSTSRSDSMILVSIDKKNKKIKMTSFLRDSWVYIPDNGYAKLNAAYAYGGAGLVMDTIEYNFGVKIDNYMKVDYDIFRSIINDLGGVTVEVTKQEAEFINSTSRQNIEYGEKVSLNGDEALVYCRIRYLDSDFMRAYRQRKVLGAVKSELSNASIPTLLKVVGNILPKVETDIDKGEMAWLGAGAVLKYRNYEMSELRVPVDGSYESRYFGSQSALSINFEKNRAALKDYIYNDVDPDTINP